MLYQEQFINAMKRLIPLTILAVLFPVILLWPALVRAQEPDTWNGWTILHYSELIAGLENGPQTCGTGDPLIGQINEYGYMAARSNANVYCESWQVGVFEASLGDLTTGSGGGQMAVTIADDTGGSQWHFYYYAGGWSGSLGNYGNGTTTINVPEGTTQLAIAYYSPYGYLGAPYIVGITLTNITAPNGEIPCATVQNGDFFAEDGWLLAGGAAITNSILTLPAAGQSAQNLLTLNSLTAYNAVISTSDTVSSTTINVSLGTDIQTLEITTSGRYTASFTTPTLGGPIAYGLENDGANSIDLDFTCVYTAGTDDGQISDCIAPINGDFDIATDWVWMRGAKWYYPAEEASLSWVDTALVYSTYTYTLPTITTGQHLLMSFTSQKYQADPEGGIMGRVKSGVDSVSFTYEVYPTEYTFETSLDYLAGHSDAEIAFVNPGLDGSPIFSGTADVSLDDVCIFVANRGPTLPAPTDPNALPPVDLGVNYTSCDDVDGILAWFGVNVQQYRADYLAGTSIWDPIGWVPWLISAMWNILAAWLCIFMAAFVTLVDILEYLINNFLNIGNWLVRSWPIFVAFLLSVWRWLNATVPNLWTWLGQAIILILLWFYLSGGNIVVFTAFMLSYFIQAVLDFLSWLGFDLPDNVIELLLNGLKSMANIFITGWNLFIIALGGGISDIIGIIVWVWNLLVPVLEAIWGYISSVSLIGLIAGLIFGFSWAIMDLLWMVFRWLWSNVLLVVNLPLQLYYGFDQGTKSEAFDALIACTGENFWCTFFAGIQVINQTVGQTILYPIVIAGIILATIGIFWRNIWKMFTIDIA